MKSSLARKTSDQVRDLTNILALLRGKPISVMAHATQTSVSERPKASLPQTPGRIFEDFASFVKPYTLERTASETGIPKEQLQKLANI